MRSSFVVVFAPLVAALVPAASGCRSRAAADVTTSARSATSADDGAPGAAGRDREEEEAAPPLDPTLASDVRATLRGDGRTDLEIRTPADWGRPGIRRVRVARDKDASVATAVGIRVVAELPSSAIVLVDEYAAPEAAGCSGKEAFLRVIAVSGASARETFKRRVGSCRGDVRLAAQHALTWSPLASTLEAKWSSGARDAVVERLRIRGDGTVALASVD